jgi:integrase
MAKTDSIRIDTKTGRGKLKPRRDPYWHKIATRKHLGARKLADGCCSWIARLTTPDRKYLFRALGDDAEMDFDEATDAARDWFDGTEEKVAGGADIKYTLAQAIVDYEARIRASKGKKAADGIAGRLTKHLSDRMKAKAVADLTTREISRWLDSQVRQGEEWTADQIRASRDTANRRLSVLKACLNLAFRNGIVANDTAWRRVKAFEKTGAARTLFLTETQVADLLAKSKGGLHNVIKAGVLTGARRGELFALTARDFDPKEGTLRVAGGKTGRRDVYLSDTAVAFFKKLAKDKLPEVHLLTKDDGSPWPEDDLTRPFKAAARAAKLPLEATFYSLRHYHISKALLAGVQPQVVAENCGTSLRMIEKHYGKFLKTDRRAMFNGVAL